MRKKNHDRNPLDLRVAGGRGGGGRETKRVSRGNKEEKKKPERTKVKTKFGATGNEQQTKMWQQTKTVREERVERVSPPNVPKAEGDLRGEITNEAGLEERKVFKREKQRNRTLRDGHKSPLGGAAGVRYAPFWFVESLFIWQDLLFIRQRFALR